MYKRVCKNIVLKLCFLFIKTLFVVSHVNGVYLIYCILFY